MLPFIKWAKLSYDEPVQHLDEWSLSKNRYSKQSALHEENPNKFWEISMTFSPNNWHDTTPKYYDTNTIKYQSVKILNLCVCL